MVIPDTKRDKTLSQMWVQGSVQQALWASKTQCPGWDGRLDIVSRCGEREFDDTRQVARSLVMKVKEKRGSGRLKEGRWAGKKRHMRRATTCTNRSGRNGAMMNMDMARQDKDVEHLPPRDHTTSFSGGPPRLREAKNPCKSHRAL